MERGFGKTERQCDPTNLAPRKNYRKRPPSKKLDIHRVADIRRRHLKFQLSPKRTCWRSLVGKGGEAHGAAGVSDVR